MRDEAECLAALGIGAGGEQGQVVGELGWRGRGGGVEGLFPDHDAWPNERTERGAARLPRTFRFEARIGEVGGFGLCSADLQFRLLKVFLFLSLLPCAGTHCLNRRAAVVSGGDR